MFLTGKTVPAWDHARGRLRPNGLRQSLRIPTFGTQHFVSAASGEISNFTDRHESQALTIIARGPRYRLF